MKTTVVNSKKAIAVISSIVMMVSLVINFTVTAMTYCTLTYMAGDVDNLVGASEISFEKIINTTFDVAASDRFSRKGYYIKSWSIPSTGETVETGSQYTMPSRNITFMANWTPQTYSVTFAGVKGKTTSGEANIYINATYGDTMTLPENPFIYDGYTFSGWKYDGVTYDAGDSFQIPAIISGSKIVISAVWKKGTVITTTAVTTTTPVVTTTTTTTPVTTTPPVVTTTTTTTPVVTTTTTTTTPVITTTQAPVAITTTSTSLNTSGTIVKTVYIGTQIDYSIESKKMYNIEIQDILNEGIIDKMEINFSSNSGNIGTIIMGIGAMSNGNWSQIDCNETSDASTYSLNFANSEFLNNLDGNSIQIGYWWGNISQLNIDSVTFTLKPNQVKTTAATTTLPETTSTTTTIATTTTVKTTSTTTAPVTTTTTTTENKPVTTVTTFKESQHSKVVQLNRAISKSQRIEINAGEIVSANQIIESIQLTFNTNGETINAYALNVMMNSQNNVWTQSNFIGNCVDNQFVIGTEISDLLVNENTIYVGYRSGDAQNITLESIKVNYRIDCGDYNNDGVVDNYDAEALKKYMVGIETPGFDINSQTADVNEDGIVNVFDYMTLSRMF